MECSAFHLPLLERQMEHYIHDTRTPFSNCAETKNQYQSCGILFLFFSFPMNFVLKKSHATNLSPVDACCQSSIGADTQIPECSNLSHQIGTSIWSRDESAELRFLFYSW